MGFGHFKVRIDRSFFGRADGRRLGVTKPARWPCFSINCCFSFTSRADRQIYLEHVLFAERHPSLFRRLDDTGRNAGNSSDKPQSKFERHSRKGGICDSNLLPILQSEFRKALF